MNCSGIYCSTNVLLSFHGNESRDTSFDTFCIFSSSHVCPPWRSPSSPAVVTLRFPYPRKTNEKTAEFFCGSNGFSYGFVILFSFRLFLFLHGFFFFLSRFFLFFGGFFLFLLCAFHQFIALTLAISIRSGKYYILIFYR